MAREVWFQLVLVHGSSSVSVDCVDLAENAKVFRLRDVVKTECANALHPVDPVDVVVYANQAAYTVKTSLDLDSLIDTLGGSMRDALIVEVRQRTETAPAYLILPETREKVEQAMFKVVDDEEDHVGVRIGVIFSPTLAVTCDHNLTSDHTVGSTLVVAMKNETANFEMIHSDSELDFAILKSTTPRQFLPPWDGSPDELVSRADLVSASFRLGISKYQEVRGKLGFLPAWCNAISTEEAYHVFVSNLRWRF